MELLAFGGASLVWNPRRRISIDAVRGNCKSFGEITVGRRRNPFGVPVVDKQGRNGVGVRKMVQARGDNVQDGYNSASETMNERDRITATGREYSRNVSSLATEGGIVDRETPQPGEMFRTPRQTGRARGLRAARRNFDEEDYATANLRHSQQKPVINMRARAPSALTSIVNAINPRELGSGAFFVEYFKALGLEEETPLICWISSSWSSIAVAAIPLLLIAPVIGFIARCVVDSIHVHIEQEVGKRFAEMESWQARRRPRVKRRWQTILDEDRDENELDEALTTSAISEYQYESDPWSMNARQPIATDTSESDSWHGKETEEERKLRQRYDYEQIKRSYTRLEPMYEQFLADSGLSSSGYWRGAGES